jgi:hypothetical protein
LRYVRGQGVPESETLLLDGCERKCYGLVEASELLLGISRGGGGSFRGRPIEDPEKRLFPIFRDGKAKMVEIVLVVIGEAKEWLPEDKQGRVP